MPPGPGDADARPAGPFPPPPVTASAANRRAPVRGDAPWRPDLRLRAIGTEITGSHPIVTSGLPAGAEVSRGLARCRERSSGSHATGLGLPSRLTIRQR
ncbi:hypothetical protein GCM10010371_46560 [Streptomyces subrutilus]|uniref:Uncharacterized protein n=1 Tax=Streptomyces subrutilus TaxID=36818 RepID=A0A5P2UYC9_9ACTN|nr:hypothetical protein CP968_33400 [Streptomyces subrutilus]GGZ81663.1 hypothetical protein GCM10010371_46560 [Streptomyces subrutilus]